MVFISPPTEKTAWPVPKDEKKYHEDTRHFVCRFEQITRHRLYNANANAGDKRPAQRSEPSHRPRDTRQQTEHIADARKHVKERCKQCPGQSDHPAAQDPDLLMNAIGDNNHAAGGLTVFTTCIMRPPTPAAIHQKTQ